MQILQIKHVFMVYSVFFFFSIPNSPYLSFLSVPEALSVTWAWCSDWISLLPLGKCWYHPRHFLPYLGSHIRRIISVMTLYFGLVISDYIIRWWSAKTSPILVTHSQKKKFTSLYFRMCQCWFAFFSFWTPFSSHWWPWFLLQRNCC